MLSRSNVNYEGRKPRRVANSNAAVAHLPTFEPAKITPRGPQPMDDGGLPPFSFVSLDMCQSENNVNHRTSVYLHKRLVVRRGHEFFLKITFSSQYIEHTHKFEVEFTIGESPDSNEGTHIVLEFALGEINGPWACRVVENVGNTVKIGITPSPDCIVGKFHTYVVVDAWDGRHRSPIDENSIIYILFNAWCSDDDVSLPDESQRTAYIMADSGVVYTGQAEQFSARPWEFGQFEQNILDYCIDILDDSKMSLYNRGNVIQVTRKVSALVNSQDDYGILEGKWRGSYAMGTAPTAWTSSVDILEKYATTKSPVCYAQCWVYACVFNTIMRCLGIPCRVVTNFCSAHDNTGNLKTDIVIDENGRMLKERCKDSIWNYHCWNEGYMKRGDLPVGFDGWQILDATPQETSEGIYCCGPAPVKAIKAGLLCYPFDARFIFAEVNSNIHYHLLKPNGTTEMIHIDKTYVGRLILTQDVIPNAAKDITNDYKPLEGTDADKETMDNAEGFGCMMDRSWNVEPVVKMELVSKSAEFGKDFQIELSFKNKTDQAHTVSVSLQGNVIYYTGVPEKVLKKWNFTVSLEPGEFNLKPVEINKSDYLDKLLEQGFLHFIAFGTLEDETRLTCMTVVTFRMPQLSIQVSPGTTAVVGQKMYVTVSFTNTLDFVLTKPTLKLSGSGLIPVKTLDYKEIQQGFTITFTEAFVPWKSGNRKLIGNLDCENLSQIIGSVDIAVYEG